MEHFKPVRLFFLENLSSFTVIGQGFLLTPSWTLDIILFFGQSQTASWLSKISTKLSYMQSFRHIGLKLLKIVAIQNRYPIMVYGVMSDRKGKNPRPLENVHLALKFIKITFRKDIQTLVAEYIID